jgi:manganese/zinc/iron transport system substrate-binding protein
MKISSLIFLLFILIYGCTNQEILRDFPKNQNNGKLMVLTTIAMINDLVAQVGGDHIESRALIRGELDPHTYELVKGDDEKFARADLIFYNGLGLEHGLSLRQNLENNPKAISVGDFLLKEDPSSIICMDGQYDPHIWMDIALWVKTINPIVDALSQKDPLHAEDYQRRGEILRLRMEEENRRAYEILQALPQNKRFLITSHDAFQYFTKHYLADSKELSTDAWRARCAAPEGLAPDAQLSVVNIQEILDHVTRYSVSVLFPESNVSKDSLRKILNAGKEKGLNLRLAKECLFGDSMGSNSYLEMISHNVNVIATELIH